MFGASSSPVPTICARGTPSNPADLAGHDIVAFEGVDTARNWHFANAPATSAAEVGLGIAHTGSNQLGR